MESQNDLYPSFLSPFSESQARPYEIDYQVPFEYQMGMQIREKLPPLNFNTLNEDTLFFLFYLFGNDHVQLLAAAELYRRDWRYHKEERIWLTRIKNIMPDHKYDTYETGVYCVFDVQLWRKTHKSMRIDYEKLDGRKDSLLYMYVYGISFLLNSKSCSKTTTTRFNCFEIISTTTLGSTTTTTICACIIV
jgi:CCR4-NOT transcription complex subunit 2